MDTCRSPRYRWDQLLVLAWRTYLPLVLVGVFFVTIIFVCTLNTSDHSTSQELFLFLPLIISKSKNKNLFIGIINILILFILSLFSIIFPYVPFFIAIISSILFLSQPMAYYFPEYKLTTFLNHFIIFIHYTNIINYLAFFYNFFYKNEIFIFRLLIVSLNTVIVLYSLTARYYFATKVLTIPICVILILGFMSLYCRAIVNLYIFITNTVLRNKELYDLFEGQDNLPPNNTSNKPWIDFSKKTTNNHHYANIPPQKWSFSMKAGLCASFITCGAACYAAYYAKVQADFAKLQADHAKIQADHAKIQTNEFRRQNDLECLNQNLITKEEYCLRNPLDCQKSTIANMSVEEKAERMLASKKAGIPGIKISSPNDFRQEEQHYNH